MLFADRLNALKTAPRADLERLSKNLLSGCVCRFETNQQVLDVTAEVRMDSKRALLVFLLFEGTGGWRARLICPVARQVDAEDPWFYPLLAPEAWTSK